MRAEAMRTRSPAWGLGVLALIFAAWGGFQPAAAADAWQALRDGGTVAILRHARAPGGGDPPGFRIEDCATQRNLSAEGREQARRTGERFRAEGVQVRRVLSSRWCRSLETARLAFDAAEPFPPLDSLFGRPVGREGPTDAMREVIRDWRGQDGVLVLVTHQVNITELTGLRPAEGEVVVLKPSDRTGFDPVGTLRF